MTTFLSNINAALLFRRFIWTSVYIAMFRLIWLMSSGLAADQPVLFTIIIMAAFVGSIGLVYARRSFHTGAWLTGFAALALGISGISVHTILETSYWSSTIELINADFQRESEVRHARQIVSEKRRERYEHLAGNKTSGQIEALIEKERLNPIYTRSDGCSDVTLPDSRKFCDGFFALKAEYEAAKGAGKLEAFVWDAATGIETNASRNIASAAMMASKIFGGEVYKWIGIIVAFVVLFTQLVTGLSLYIGYAPEKVDQKSFRKADLPERKEDDEQPVKAADTPPDGPKPPSPPPTRFSGKSPTLGPFAARPLPESKDDEEPESEDEKIRVLRPETIDDLTGKWIAARAVSVPANLGMQASYLYEDYSHFCRKELQIEPVSNAHFGRSVKRLKVRRQKVSGVLRYGLKLHRAEVEKLRATG